MMIKSIKAFFLVLLATAFSFSSFAQIIPDPTEWTFSVKQVEGNKYDVVFHCKVNNGWHIYSLDPGGDGSFLPPYFDFSKSPDVKLVGDPREEGKKIDETIEDIGTVHYYKEVDYIQTVEVPDGVTIIKGEYTYMTCNDETCLPPETKDFAVSTTGGAVDASTTGAAADTQKKTTDDTTTLATDDTKKEKSKSLLTIFLLALGGGILAILTPCVYSMIPITVSFFTKRSKTRAEGIRNATWYSLSIIIIFTVLGVAISAIFGADTLNVISTHWIPNLIFFAIFVIFGISFLGAFEISLPASWTSKTDAKANTNSFKGIFFMALTLVIVSFSCTGPIIGPLIVGAAKGGFQGPILGMLGFSIGLAMPFALFAVFPGLLNNMAKSGGWLNQVKVTLGFIELMLALKFLSNADLQMGWRIMDREVFIALWIVLSVLLGLYLLGKLKMSHDDANPKNMFGQEYVSIFKLFLAIGCFSFAVYMTPGMWGAPLKRLSAFVPPMGTQDFVLGANAGGAVIHGGDDNGVSPKKYVSDLKMYEPEAAVKYGLITYYDYKEALEASKVLNKPIMLDFTGINCINCRKMEGQVWSDPEVMKRMMNDFIVVSLFMDAQNIDIPKDEQYYSEVLKKDVNSLGRLNSDIQAAKFNTNGMPIYYFIDADENVLIEDGYGYDSDVSKFIAHLDKVKEEYKKKHP